MPTLEQIAEMSQVSRSTVSRVINNAPHVKAETRQKVRDVVDRLHYQPHAVARSLAAGRTRILGIIVPAGITSTFEDPFFPVFTRGVTAACYARDYSVMLWLVEPEYEHRMINDILSNGLLAGVIVSTIHLPDANVQALLDSGLPFVLIGRSEYAADISYVDVENVRGAYDLVTYLLRLGFRRIATITGPLDTVTGRDRRDGYVEALESVGIEADSSLIKEGDFWEPSGYYAMSELIRQSPDAVFVANDMMAFGAMRALREHGLQVPNDLAVVGFDDIASAALSSPPLTTVRQPTRQMGVVATDMLIDMIEYPHSAPRQVVLPTELVIRESCHVNPPHPRKGALVL